MSNLIDLTPKELRDKCWPLPGCPALFYSEESNKFILIGEIIHDPNAYSISERIGANEIAISVPEELLKKLKPNP